MEVFLGIIGFVWCVLCIILFFKVWGMCNNVGRILDLLMKDQDKEDNSIKERSKTQQKREHPKAPLETRINPWV